MNKKNDLEVFKLSKTYQSKSTKVKALKEVSFDVKKILMLSIS